MAVSNVVTSYYFNIANMPRNNGCFNVSRLNAVGEALFDAYKGSKTTSVTPTVIKTTDTTVTGINGVTFKASVANRFYIGCYRTGLSDYDGNGRVQTFFAIFYKVPSDGKAVADESVSMTVTDAYYDNTSTLRSITIQRGMNSSSLYANLASGETVANVFGNKYVPILAFHSQKINCFSYIGDTGTITNNKGWVYSYYPGSTTSVQTSLVPSNIVTGGSNMVFGTYMRTIITSEEAADGSKIPVYVLDMNNPKRPSNSVYGTDWSATFSEGCMAFVNNVVNGLSGFYTGYSGTTRVIQSDTNSGNTYAYVQSRYYSNNTNIVKFFGHPQFSTLTATGQNASMATGVAFLMNNGGAYLSTGSWGISQLFPSLSSIVRNLHFYRNHNSSDTTKVTATVFDKDTYGQNSFGWIYNGASNPAWATRSGYRLAGWSTSRTGSATIKPNDTFSSGTADLNLYAVWVKTATITIDPYGGSLNGSTSVSTVVVDASSTVSPGKPTRNGYSFLGWYKTANVGTMSNIPTSGCWASLPSRYIRGNSGTNNSTLTLVDNGSSGDQYFNKFSSTTKILKLETSTSSKGVGWSKTYTITSTDSAAATARVVFIAKAPVATYFYPLVGGTNAADATVTWYTLSFGTNSYYTYMYYVSVPAGNKTATVGYTVLCSANEPDSATSGIVDGNNPATNQTAYIAYYAIQRSNTNTYTVDSAGTNQTLLALWEPKRYSITYSLGSGVFNNPSVYLGRWNTNRFRVYNPTTSVNSAGGMYSYVPIKPNTHLTSSKANDPTYFGVERPAVKTTITTSFSAASSVSSKTSTKSVEAKKWTLTGLSDGQTHRFYGITTSSATTNAGVTFTGTSYTVTAANTVEGRVPALFSSLNFGDSTVTFTASDYSATPTYTAITLPTIPAKTGYQINGGWRSGSTTGTQVGAAGASYTPTASATLYAGYTPNIATIQFHINGGTITTDTTATTRYRVYNNIVQRSTDSGVTWSNLTNTITSDVTTNYNLYNVGTYGATRDGYFYGSSTANVINASYRTAATGGTIISADDGDVNPATVNRITGRTDSLIPTNGATYTLYINWVAKTYTITYNANGGSGAPGNQTKTHGVDITLSTTKPTRNGYWFAGWSTSSTAIDPTATYNPGSTYSTNANLTLYAVWWKCAYIYDSTWKPAIPYIYHESAWKRSEPYVYDGSAWK